MTGASVRRGDTEEGSVLGRPALAVVTFDSVDDGISRVARMLRRSLEKATLSEPWLASLDPASTSSSVTGLERARFAGKVLSSQLAGRVDWLLFDHMGIARVQNLVPRRVRRPFGVVLHGIEAWGRSLRWGEISALRAARLRLAVSHFTARRTTAEHPELDPVVACPLGLNDEEPTGRVNKRLLERVRSNSTLIVGRLAASQRHKGHDELLAAWPLVRARFPPAQLVIVGRGDDLERLRRKAGSLGLGDSVLFAGFVDEATLAALRRRVKVYAMPSRGEGFGLVYLEAMRAGLPCIASNADAAAEVVLHKKTGLLVEPEDRHSLANAVIRLLTNESLRRKYGEAGRRHYEQRYTFAAFHRRLVPILTAAFGDSE